MSAVSVRIMTMVGRSGSCFLKNPSENFPVSRAPLAYTIPPRKLCPDFNSLPGLAQARTRSVSFIHRGISVFENRFRAEEKLTPRSKVEEEGRGGEEKKCKEKSWVNHCTSAVDCWKTSFKIKWKERVVTSLVKGSDTNRTSAVRRREARLLSLIYGNKKKERKNAQLTRTATALIAQR